MSVDRLVMAVSFLLLVLLVAVEAKAQKSQQPVPPVKQTVLVLGSVAPVSLADSSRVVVVIDTQQHALAFQDVEDYLRTMRL